MLCTNIKHGGDMMKSKKISKMLAPVSGIMSFMLVMGVMTTPVFADEVKSNDVAVQESIKTDYATYINSTTEKSGFKLTLSKVTASKNKMTATVTIECPKAIDEDTLKNSIFSLVVKKTDCETYRESTRKIDDKTLEITFNAMSFKGIPENADLRFDVILPQFNLNGWVNANVDLIKNYDKIIEKDILINNDKAGMTYNKFESDVLGTTIYCERAKYDENVDYDEQYSDDDSKILIKCDDKIYDYNDRNHYYNHDDNISLQAFTSKSVTYDDIKNAESVSLIPVICTLKNKDIDEIYSNFSYEEADRETTDNVEYEKKFEFADGTDGELSKVERQDNKIKVYCSADTDKKSLLMAIGINGHCKGEDGYFSGEPNKVIYKNPDDATGYIVEFDNVNKNVAFSMYSDKEILGHSDNFEFGQETKIK